MKVKCCISSVSYIKPQLDGVRYADKNSCISSVSYIKPQLSCGCRLSLPVVYRPFPTSNHNPSAVATSCKPVVYRPFPTSNHNVQSVHPSGQELYIVRFLHQTTTTVGDWFSTASCISSVSYIKPQLFLINPLKVTVVYRPFPTSNHNRPDDAT